MQTEANWPIRVGGIYVPNYPNRGSWVGSRVTAIDGDMVYVTMRTQHTRGDIEEHGSSQYDTDLFRRCYFPEDQSPLPELIEALEGLLKAIPKQIESPDWCQDELTVAVRSAREALAKVTVSEPVPEEVAA